MCCLQRVKEVDNVRLTTLDASVNWDECVRRKIEVSSVKESYVVKTDQADNVNATKLDIAFR